MHLRVEKTPERRQPPVQENNTIFSESQMLHDNILLIQEQIRANEKKMGEMEDAVKDQPGLADAIKALEEENKVNEAQITGFKEQINRLLGRN